MFQLVDPFWRVALNEPGEIFSRRDLCQAVVLGTEPFQAVCVRLLGLPDFMSRAFSTFGSKQFIQDFPP
ncbi:hypothetical protein [Arthrobacter sp. efr-133-TYG-118]|uniref:hypothetical protein n=1 Tax=Arthrobacter sp. efr-133-TYG-118 TaxID=3040279 RepID=UPI00254A263C|nr:hypothetical protein [Arthrobacter sp. efr-133-TYG-118]